MTGYPQVRDGVLLECKNSRGSVVGIARVTRRDVTIIRRKGPEAFIPTKKLFRLANQLMQELNTSKVKINSWHFTIQDMDGVARAIMYKATHNG